jgi:hypothetical protein
MTLYYLSFCDPDKPKGQQFLGATIVEADSSLDAVSKTHRLKINPGGEVMIVELEEPNLEAVKRFINEFVPCKEIMSQPHTPLAVLARQANLLVAGIAGGCDDL